MTTTETAPLRVLSLGAGVQSTTLALMAARGDLPMPDCAIFADTGWEPRRVYRHLEWLESVLPFPVHHVRREGLDLGQLAIAVARGEVSRAGAALPPWYTDHPFGMLPKQCSKEFKTRVVQRKIREMLGLAPGERGPKGTAVHQWIGISLDEADRMKPSEVPWIRNQWPLLDLRMRRRDCEAWMAERQYPRAPKSACVFCPYSGDNQRRDMRDNAPDDWSDLIAFDKQIRPGFTDMEGQAFVHRQRVPIDQADLTTATDRGQGNLFTNECEGMCGV